MLIDIYEMNDLLHISAPRVKMISIYIYIWKIRDLSFSGEHFLGMNIVGHEITGAS
jgi:hypothetical protein